MQKVTDFLENNIEWIAIGLGALFMLYMTWSYVLTPVAGVQVGQETLGPGEIDEYTYTHVGKELESRMGENQKLAATVPSYLAEFRNTMNWTKAPTVVLDNVFPLIPDVELPPPTVVVDPRTPGVPAPRVPRVGDVKVTELPVPPPAEPSDHKFGRSVVLLPDENGQVPPPPPPGQPVEGGVDKDWITQMFKLNMAGLDAAFQSKRIPPAPLNMTTFLQVEMERQELDDSGNAIPGTEKIVQSIPVYRTNTPPPPFPAEDAPKNEQGDYLNWATTNTGDVIQPLFYTIAKGDQWAKPGTQAANPMDNFDPRMYLTGPIPAWATPEQRDQINQERRAETKRRQEEGRQNRPTRPPTGGRPGRDGAVPPDAMNFAVAPPGSRPPPSRGGLAVPPDIMGMEGGFPGAYPGGFPGAGGATPANLPQPGVDYPSGEQFEPTKWKDKTIEIWAHDDKVEPEKTYQYRVRYKIKNPIWTAANAADPPALADQFALVSAWSAWSAPVTIPPLVNFFVLNPPMSDTATTCRFEVFRWEKGEPRSAVFTVGFGDEIGGTKEGLDFSTGWTVVDFRSDFRSTDRQILLVNDQGKLVTRSYRTDVGDPLYRSLKDQINAAKAVENVAVPVGPVGAGR